jgi:Ca2+-binding EF-hand superfamily protein
VLEVVDTDTDRKVTYVEWINAGGSKRSFELVDQNKDGMVTRTELIRFGSSARFLDTTRRYVDFNKDNKLTPRDFRSPAGVRVLRFEF